MNRDTTPTKHPRQESTPAEPSPMTCSNCGHLHFDHTCLAMAYGHCGKKMAPNDYCAGWLPKEQPFRGRQKKD